MNNRVTLNKSLQGHDKDKQIFTVTNTPPGSLVSKSLHIHVFGCRESLRTHTDTHWKNRQTQPRRAPGMGSNLQPSCCEATPPRRSLFSKRNLLWRRAEHKHNLPHLLHPPRFLCVTAVTAQLSLTESCRVLHLSQTCPSLELLFTVTHT